MYIKYYGIAEYVPSRSKRIILLSKLNEENDKKHTSTLPNFPSYFVFCDSMCFLYTRIDQDLHSAKLSA